MFRSSGVLSVTLCSTDFHDIIVNDGSTSLPCQSHAFLRRRDRNLSGFENSVPPEIVPSPHRPTLFVFPPCYAVRSDAMILPNGGKYLKAIPCTSVDTSDGTVRRASHRPVHHSVGVLGWCSWILNPADIELCLSVWVGRAGEDWLDRDRGRSGR